MFDKRVMDVIARVNALREQVNDHWQVPADEARLLAVIALARGAGRILEIGTSYGFSTLHFAAVAQQLGGHVHSIDIDPRKTKFATQHLDEAGLADVATLHTGDAVKVLSDGATAGCGPFELCFIDAVKEQSFDYLKVALPLLGERAVIMTDNTVTHREQLQGFVDHLRDLSHGRSSEIPVGNGFELTIVN